MHRDIKPTNLGILGFSAFQGVILDLDEAKLGLSSHNHNNGTVSYLAPEILAIKDWDGEDHATKSPDKPRAYTNKVDIFALGLTTHGLFYDRNFTWQRFTTADNPLPTRKSLTNELFDSYWDYLAAELCENEFFESLARLLLVSAQKMTQFDTTARSDARSLLETFQIPTKDFTKGGITALTPANSKRTRDVDPLQAVKKAKQG